MKKSRLIIMLILSVLFLYACTDNNTAGSGSNGGDNGNNKPVSPEDSEIINATIRAVSDEDNMLKNLFFSPAVATNGSELEYVWNFDDGESQKTDTNIIEHTFSMYGKDYNVVLSLKNIKNNKVTEANITVSLPAPTLTFTYQVKGLDIYLTPVLTGASINDMKYEWDFGDGTEKVTSTGQNIVFHRYASSGRKTITLTGSSEKLANNITTSLDINISNRIELGNISIDKVSSDRLTYDFSISGSIKDKSANQNDSLEYRWNFGDGIVSEWHKGSAGTTDKVTHTYGKYAKSYNVQVEARINNTDYSDTNKVVGIELPVLTMTNNANGLDISFAAQSSYQLAGNVNYIWDFGDGTEGSGREVRHTYSKSGIYQVSVKMTSDKLSYTEIKAQQEIRVTDDIKNLDIVYVKDKDNPLKYTFNTNAVSINGKKLTYEWLIDGKKYSTQQVEHIFSKYNGNYEIVLKVSLEGSREVYEAPKELIITDKPDIIINDFDYTIMTNKENTFTTSEYLNHKPVKVLINPVYTWDFGDGQSAAGAAPKHTYTASGLYTVTLSVKADNLAGEIKTTKKIGVLENESITVTNFNAECTPVNNIDIINRQCVATADITNIDNLDLLDVVWVDTTGTESVKVSRLGEKINLILDWPLAIANRNSNKDFPIKVDIRVSGSSKPVYSGEITVNIANYVNYTLFPYDDSGTADFGTGPFIKLEDTGYGIGGRYDFQSSGTENKIAGKTLDLGPLADTGIKYKWGYNIKKNDGTSYSGVIDTPKIDFDIIDITKILEQSKFTGFIYDTDRVDSSVEYTVFYLELYDPENKIISKPLRVYYNGTPEIDKQSASWLTATTNALYYIAPRIQTSKIDCGYDVLFDEKYNDSNYFHNVKRNRFAVPVIDTTWIEDYSHVVSLVNVTRTYPNQGFAIGTGSYHLNSAWVTDGILHDYSPETKRMSLVGYVASDSKVEVMIGTENKSYVQDRSNYKYPYYIFFPQMYANGAGRIYCKIDHFTTSR